MSNLEMVNHMNYIGEDAMVYCRKEHVVKAVVFDACFCCEYLFGSLQGEGVECRWDDVPAEFPITRVRNPWREYERVSELIENDILQQGGDDWLDPDAWKDSIPKEYLDKMANVDTENKRVLAYVLGAINKQIRGEELTGGEENVLEVMSNDPNAGARVTWYTVNLWESMA